MLLCSFTFVLHTVLRPKLGTCFVKSPGKERWIEGNCEPPEYVTAREVLEMQESVQAYLGFCPAEGLEVATPGAQSRKRTSQGSWSSAPQVLQPGSHASSKGSSRSRLATLALEETRSALSSGFSTDREEAPARRTHLRLLPLPAPRLVPTPASLALPGPARSG